MDILSFRRLIESGKNIRELPLRVAYYARVSTETDGQLNSLANQTSYYEEFINKNSLWSFAGGYVDEGLSGTGVSKRRSFLRMMEDARAGRFDLIVTKEISRFSRNTLDSIKYTRELLACGVGVFFQNDNINTLTPDAELRLTIMASIAQDEVRKLSERVRFGFRRAQESGVVLGQDNTYGYFKAKGRLTVNETEAAVVRRIFESYAEGKLGLRRLSNELADDGITAPSGGPFAYCTLAGIIRNPKYKGCYAGKKYATVDYRDSRTLRLPREDWLVYRDERIPPIVTEELWERANRLLEERGKNFRGRADGYQSRYAYSGKLVCAEHGTSFHRQVYRTSTGERECWSCRMYRLKGRDEGCASPTLYTSELDEVMSRVFAGMIPDRERIADELTSLYGEISPADEGDCRAGLLRERAAVVRRRDKLFELCADGSISNAEFRERNSALTEKLAGLDGELKAIADGAELRKNAMTSAAELKAELLRLLGDESFTSVELTSMLLDRITVGRKDPNTVSLDIRLTTGRLEKVSYIKGKDHSISLCETGISQAQVSRLEKGALERIKKQM